MVFIVADLHHFVGVSDRCAALLRFSRRLLVLDEAVDAEGRVLRLDVDVVARGEDGIRLDDQLRGALGLVILLRFLQRFRHWLRLFERRSVEAGTNRPRVSERVRVPLTAARQSPLTLDHGHWLVAHAVQLGLLLSRHATVFLFTVDGRAQVAQTQPELHGLRRLGQRPAAQRVAQVVDALALVDSRRDLAGEDPRQGAVEAAAGAVAYAGRTLHTIRGKKLVGCVKAEGVGDLPSAGDHIERSVAQ